MSIRVIVADDHPLVRDGLRHAVEDASTGMVVVGEAADGREALEVAQRQDADVYLFDITMPNLNGLEAMRRLLKMNPSARVIILSLHDTPGLVRQAVEGGARGYLLKATASDEIVNAVRQVHAGGMFFSPQIAEYAPPSGPAAKATEPQASDAGRLTSREREVLQLIAEGLTSKEIAAQLNIAVNTVQVHRTNLMAKVGLHKQTDLVRYAVKEGIAGL